MRALLAAGALFALGASVAPGHAETPAPATDPVFAAQFDEALPKFEPSAESADLIALDDQADEVLWEQAGSGTASWYGPRFAGKRTASGETFDPDQLTAAHRTLPFGTKVRVSRGDKSVVVRINDRGPFARNRLIDVSQAAARELGLIGPGHGTVSLALLSD